MSQVELGSDQVTAKDQRALPQSSSPVAHDDARLRRRVAPVLVTLGTVALAALLTWAMWEAYMAAPWTRDGMVRVYVVTMAPEVAGRIVELPVADNQFVQKGDLLMVIDPTNYTIARDRAEAAVEQAKATADNAQAEAERREKLTTLAVSEEQKQIYASSALSAKAAYDQALTIRDQARVNLERTRIVSPVNGYVTNLLVQLGDYVNVRKQAISVVNADSF
jgi:multidrug resistance efflux pump